MIIWKKLKLDIIKYIFQTIILSLLMISEAFILEIIIKVAKSKSYDTFFLITLIVIVFIVSQAIVYFYQQFLTQKLSNKAIALYRKDIFEKLSERPLEQLSTDSKGMFLASLTNQTDLISQNYFYVIFWGGYLFCQFILSVIVAFYVNPTIAIAALLLSLPNLLIAIFFKKKLEKRQKILIDAVNDYTSDVKDLIDGIIEWKIYSNNESIKKVFSCSTQNLFLKQVFVERFQYFVISLNHFFSNLLFFGSWLVGIYFIIVGQLNLASMVGFSQLLIRISFPVYSSSDLITQYISGKKILLSINEMLNISPNTFLEADMIETIEDIEIKNYSFISSDNREIEPLNFTIHKNEKYLLKGASGIGKTTFLRSLFKEYTSYNGELLLNGKNIKNIDENSIFKQIGYVSQNPHIFSASLRENLTLFSNHYTEQELFEVLHFVELGKWANSASLSNFLGDKGLKISGGEVKRVALARVLLANKPILFLDELTSGLDRQTANKLETALLKLDKTIIYISHTVDRDVEMQFNHLITFKTKDILSL